MISIDTICIQDAYMTTFLKIYMFHNSFLTFWRKITVDQSYVHVSVLCGFSTNVITNLLYVFFSYSNQSSWLHSPLITLNHHNYFCHYYQLIVIKQAIIRYVLIIHTPMSCIKVPKFNLISLYRSSTWDCCSFLIKSSYLEVGTSTPHWHSSMSWWLLHSLISIHTAQSTLPF